MRAVVQRVLRAWVETEGRKISQIDNGLLVYVSIGKTDTVDDARFIAEKLVNLRIFADEADKMNRSLPDVGGSILMVSNFTLHGDCRKGRRPSFDGAAGPEMAEQLYEKLSELIAEQGVAVEKGVFGQHMQISSVNDGPVTFIIDSSRLF
ncbi:MAG: D-tyrosyl-tRNA(Tyr) deacylase [Planctomycetota bacterium]|nr:MAG: D-tyrosyl-tRNA(Tyr) deacylase [Planctomycetota bacterium]